MIKNEVKQSRYRYRCHMLCESKWNSGKDYVSIVVAENKKKYTSNKKRDDIDEKKEEEEHVKQTQN